MISDIKELKLRLPIFKPFLPKSSPTILEDTCGVYCVAYKKYFYIGMATNLSKRLDWHRRAFLGEVNSGGGVSSKYWNAVRKSQDKPKFYILEYGDQCKNSIVRSGLERMWILLFWKFCRSSMLNTMFVPDVQRTRPKMFFSIEERENRSQRMRLLVNTLNKDPIYRKRKSESAKEAFKQIPDSIKEKTKKAVSKASRERFQHPSERQLQASRVKKQWKNPEFQKANSERLKRLRQSGWKAGVRDVVKLVLPDGSTYFLLKKDLSQTLGLGGRNGGVESLFNKELLSDWKITTVASIPGTSLLKNGEKLSEHLEKFRLHPFVKWILREKAKNDKLFATKPIRFILEGSEMRTLKKTNVVSAGKFLYPVEDIRPYKTLYEFASCELPVLRQAESFLNHHEYKSKSASL